MDEDTEVITEASIVPMVPIMESKENRKFKEKR